MSCRRDREREHFDRLADNTGSVWWGSTKKAGQLRLDERAELAIRHANLTEGKLILEPGAGNAEFTQRLAASGATIIGVELAPRQVELANQRLLSFPNAQVLEGDIARLDFPNAAFDAVVGNSVLHHFDLTTALPEIRRVLKYDGFFFFTEPNMLNPQIAIEKNVKFIGRILQNSPDETAFFRWKISAMLTNLGFRRVWTKPFDFLHPGVPDLWIPFIQEISHFLSGIPIIKEIAGSIQISARG
jgi:SAM-dependent methyltransferase